MIFQYLKHREEVLGIEIIRVIHIGPLFQKVLFLFQY